MIIHTLFLNVASAYIFVSLTSYLDFKCTLGPSTWFCKELMISFFNASVITGLSLPLFAACRAHICSDGPLHVGIPVDKV